MSDIFIEGHTFERQDYRKNPLPKGEYEGCTFVNCDFSDSDISHIHFSECTFLKCNLSMMKVVSTSFQNVTVIDSKVLGIMFDTANNFLFELSFENCVLNFASFYGMKIPKTTFKNCSIQEVNFTSVDLSGGVLENCDLLRAIFDQTNLESVDFCGAYNYALDPENSRITKAHFSLSGISGLLSKYDIIIE